MMLNEVVSRFYPNRAVTCDQRRCCYGDGYAMDDAMMLAAQVSPRWPWLISYHNVSDQVSVIMNDYINSHPS